MSEKYKVKDHESAYFMTLTVVGWVDVFTRNNHRMAVVEALRYCQENKGLELFAWCLMSNHLHLIARAKEGFTLPEIIRDLKKHTAKQIIGQMMNEPESRREWIPIISSPSCSDCSTFGQCSHQHEEGNKACRQRHPNQ